VVELPHKYVQVQEVLLVAWEDMEPLLVLTPIIRPSKNANRSSPLHMENTTASL
jgi:hypothetical protein